jgi:hypothetical protein
VVGPLEARHLQSPIYRNATDTTRVTSTHWHIAWANNLDRMDGAILALVTKARVRWRWSAKPALIAASTIG